MSWIQGPSLASPEHQEILPKHTSYEHEKENRSRKEMEEEGEEEEEE